MAQMWTSEEVFEQDLFAFSEIEGLREKGIEPTPQSLLDWEAKNGANQHRSIFDTPDLSEDVIYVVSGRGRGGVSTIIRPGAPTTVTSNMDDIIKKKIREVSGPGFSNELIEQNFRSRNNTITGAVNSEIKLQPTTSKSNRSTPSSTFTVETPTITSKTSSTNNSPKRSPSVSSIASKCSSNTSNSPEPEPAAAVVAQNPLPLSAILKKAKNDAKKKNLEKPKTTEEQNKNGDMKESNVRENGHVNGNQNDFWWGRANADGGSDTYNSWRRRDAPIANRFFDRANDQKNSNNFNISSTKEFPALK